MLNKGKQCGLFVRRELHVVLAAIVGGVLRTYQLSQQIIADDEWHAILKLQESGYGDILTSFGANDHSIPLTLLYKLAADTVGLSETVMRLPPLLAGIALLVIFPVGVRSLVGRHSRDVFAWLLAISPVLIYFARTARPYGLTVGLAPLALWAAWRWWRDGRLLDLILCAILVAVTSNLHLVSLPLLVAPVPILAALSLLEPRAARMASIRRVLLLSASAALALLVFLGPPLYFDFASLTAKSQSDAMSFESVRTAFELFSGTANPWLEGSMAILALAGSVRLFRTYPRIATYLLGCAAVQVACVVASGATWLSHGAVLARYLLGILPIFLLLVAHGLTGATALFLGSARPREAVSCGFLVLLLALGPLPKIYSYPNAFTGHAIFYFSFDPARNPYVGGLRPEHIPQFYFQLGQASSGSIRIVEAPWRYEWHYNRLPFFQRVHRQRVLIGFVNGLCSGRRFGEVPVDQPGFAFANFVQLADEGDLRRKRVDYVVFHRKRWDDRDGAIDFERCVERFQERYGNPVFVDADIVAFAVGDREPIRRMQ